MSANPLLEKITLLPEDFKMQPDAYIDSLLEKVPKQVNKKSNSRILGIGIGKGSMSPDRSREMAEGNEGRSFLINQFRKESLILNTYTLVTLLIQNLN